MIAPSFDEEKPDPHLQQMYRQHLRRLWVHFDVVLLGAWLVLSPALLGYLDPLNFGPQVARVTQEHHLAPPEWRAYAIMWSDIAAGCLLILFGSLSLFWLRWAQWGTCLTGIWLLFAPIVLWAPDGAAVNNDMLVGALAITLSILLPMMPGMSMEAMKAPEDIPPGWRYSPSSWSQRLPVIALAFLGFLFARYLAGYQLGHLSSVWNPFFSDGAASPLLLNVSKAWPVSDAGLGAVSCLLTALAGLAGDRRRWRTMPWMVGIFGVLVIPLSAAGIFLVIIQPIIAGTWSLLCLAIAAALMFILVDFLDESAAMLKFLARARCEGQALWQVFWHGGMVSGVTRDSSSPRPV